MVPAGPCDGVGCGVVVPAGAAALTMWGEATDASITVPSASTADKMTEIERTCMRENPFGGLSNLSSLYRRDVTSLLPTCSRFIAARYRPVTPGRYGLA